VRERQFNRCEIKCVFIWAMPVQSIFSNFSTVLCKKADMCVCVCACASAGSCQPFPIKKFGYFRPCYRKLPQNHIWNLTIKSLAYFHFRCHWVMNWKRYGSERLWHNLIQYSGIFSGIWENQENITTIIGVAVEFRGRKLSSISRYLLANCPCHSSAPERFMLSITKHPVNGKIKNIFSASEYSHLHTI
jgi:hypothetical protein